MIYLRDYVSVLFFFFELITGLINIKTKFRILNYLSNLLICNFDFQQHLIQFFFRVKEEGESNLGLILTIFRTKYHTIETNVNLEFS